jgi:hypothetical protein
VQDLLEQASKRQVYVTGNLTSFGQSGRRRA